MKKNQSFTIVYGLVLISLVAWCAYYLFTAPNLYVGLWGEDGSPAKFLVSITLSLIVIGFVLMVDKIKFFRRFFESKLFHEWFGQ